MKLNGAQIVCESLIKEGVEVMFGIPGGAVIPFYDALPEYPKLRHILTRHEQGRPMPPKVMHEPWGRWVCVLPPQVPGPPTW